MKFLEHDILFPSYVPMTAWMRHGPFAMWLVKAARPKRIVELGSHYGYSYFAFCQAVREAGLGTECIAVDTWKGDEHAGHYGEEVYQTVVKQNEPYSGFSTLRRKTFAEALGDVADGSVDLLHVDGRHLYEDVKDDYESWIPKLAKNAIVLFHDTMVRERGFGVWKYWAELSQTNETFNFTYQHGLGVLFRGKDLSPEMARFRELTRSEAGREALMSVFFQAGEAHALDHTLAELSRRAQQGDRALEDFLAVLKSDKILPETQLVRLPMGSDAAAGALLEARAMTKTARQELETAQQQAEATTKTIQNELSRLQESMDNTLLGNLELRRELAYARSRVHRVWKDYLIHKALLKLSKSGILPLSGRTRARWLKSAAKRDPMRSLTSAPELPAELAKMVAESAEVEELSAAGGSRGRVTKGSLEHDPGKPDILLVSHEASWTGAPILVHNVARELSARYNVTIMCVRAGGTLLKPMLEVSTGVIVLNGTPQPGDGIWRRVASFLADNKFEFAVVNSIESRSVIPLLKRAGVPTVALMHEFATYTLPTTAFTEVMSNADYTVFSTALTLEIACETTGLSSAPNTPVIPQGKCEVPVAKDNPTAREKERAKLKAQLRPPGSEEDFVVLGAGTVQLRKGVDLFIEIARKVLEAPEGRRARFVWIGPPDHDNVYGLFLGDQLLRAGIEDRVTILPSTPEIEYAYELSDAFLLSSRGDPLPNVCIDTMSLGLPVLCFDRANGFAEILRNAGLAEECVADYLDSSDLARRLINVIASPERYTALSRRMKEISAEIFDMPRYARQIEQLGQTVNVRRSNRIEDIQTIARSKWFDPGHMTPAGAGYTSREQAARDYLEKYSMGAFCRRPEPGFNPHAFAAKLIQDNGPALKTDPYAEFLREGRPEGPWLTKVLDTAGPVPASSDDEKPLRTALHIHAYYVDEMQRLLGHLTTNAARPSLFVSVADEENKLRAEHFLADYAGASEVRVVPNAGRDIGPFLTEFGRELVEGFEVIGHIHTKKSAALFNKKIVDNWTRLLFENVLGGTTGGAMLDKILRAFHADPKLGLVYPSDPHVIGWTKNWQHAKDLGERLKLGALPQAFDFPVGTMFWMRSGALRPFVDLGLEWRDYPREPIGIDATMLHALERLFGIVPLRYGFHAAVTSIEGITR